MAVYVTCEELDKILVLWCTLYAANCVRSRFFFFLASLFILLCICFSLLQFKYFSLFVYVCICLFITTYNVNI